MKMLVYISSKSEAIKLSPLVKELRKYGELFNVKVCVSGQHRDMSDQELEFFDIKPDFDLDIMKNEQNLYHVMTMTMKGESAHETGDYRIRSQRDFQVS